MTKERAYDLGVMDRANGTTKGREQITEEMMRWYRKGWLNESDGRHNWN